MAQAIVCGAGAAGLASAASLKRAGVDPAVLERGDSVGTSRRRRYADLGKHGLARAPRGIRTTLEERFIGPSNDAGFIDAVEGLVGRLDVLDERGMPRAWPEADVPGADNLFFVGYNAKVSGQLRRMRFDARRVARKVKRRARDAPVTRPAEPALSG